MKILITGAAGFIGRYVIEKVRAFEHDILATTLAMDKNVDNSSNVHWILGDLEDLEFLTTNVESFNPDIVIHLAWNK